MKTETKDTDLSSRGSQEEIHCEVHQHLGILSTNKNGWTREVNLVSWNERPVRLDLRDWSPDHAKMSKGITLNGAETGFLIEILQDLDIVDAGI